MEYAYRQSSSNISLKEEKSILRKIDDLKKRKVTIRTYWQAEAEIQVNFADKKYPAIGTCHSYVQWAIV